MNNFRGEFEIKLNGKKFKGKLSMNALRMLCKQENIELDKLHDWMNKDPMTGVCAMTYHAIKNKSLVDGKKSELPLFERFCALALDDVEQFEEMSKLVLEQLMPEDDEDSKKV